MYITNGAKCDSQIPSQIFFTKLNDNRELPQAEYNRLFSGPKGTGSEAFNIHRSIIRKGSNRVDIYQHFSDIQLLGKEYISALHGVAYLARSVDHKLFQLCTALPLYSTHYS